jgi:hypothetical protein
MLAGDRIVAPDIPRREVVGAGRRRRSGVRRSWAGPETRWDAEFDGDSAGRCAALVVLGSGSFARVVIVRMLRPVPLVKRFRIVGCVERHCVGHHVRVVAMRAVLVDERHPAGRDRRGDDRRHEDDEGREPPCDGPSLRRRLWNARHREAAEYRGAFPPSQARASTIPTVSGPRSPHRPMLEKGDR